MIDHKALLIANHHLLPGNVLNKEEVNIIVSSFLQVNCWDTNASIKDVTIIVKSNVGMFLTRWSWNISV
jgi:hypothetical protein